MKQTTIEDKLQGLYLARQVTIDEPTINEIVRQYNRYNLLYMKKTGRGYVPY